jgi:hypothetical protein
MTKQDLKKMPGKMPGGSPDLPPLKVTFIQAMFGLFKLAILPVISASIQSFTITTKTKVLYPPGK